MLNVKTTVTFTSLLTRESLDDLVLDIGRMRDGLVAEPPIASLLASVTKVLVPETGQPLPGELAGAVQPVATPVVAAPVTLPLHPVYDVQPPLTPPGVAPSHQPVAAADVFPAPAGVPPAFAPTPALPDHTDLAPLKQQPVAPITDKFGTVWDPELHAAKRRDGTIPLKNDESFKAKRKTSSSEPAAAATGGIQPVTKEQFAEAMQKLVILQIPPLDIGQVIAHVTLGNPEAPNGVEVLYATNSDKLYGKALSALRALAISAGHPDAI